MSKKGPSVTKFVKGVEERNVQNMKNTGHTVISFYLNIIAFVVMGYIGVKYMNSSNALDRAFSQYAFLLSGFGLLGLFAIDWFDNRQINLKPKKFNEMDTTAFVFVVFIVFIIAVIIDFVLNVVVRLALDDTDLILYYVFAGICEEAFFRAFLINIIIGIFTRKGKKPRLIVLISAIVISSFAFMMAHLAVYGQNLPMLLSTLAGGFLLGTAYILTRDIGALAVAHGLKNVIGYINMVRF